VFRRLDKKTALEAGQGRTLFGALLLAGLGFLPAGQGPDIFLAWACLLAPALGGFVGAAGIGLLWGATVPAGLTLGLVWSDLFSPVDLPTPLWAALFVAGLFLCGMALGRLFPGSGVPLAGLVMFLGLLASGLSIQGGFAGPGGSWARTHPGLAALFLELSPLVWAYDCAGLDWTHAQEDMYRLSGVEWFGRRAWRGTLAGPFSIVVGCTLFLLASMLQNSSRSWIRSAAPSSMEPGDDPTRPTHP